MYEVHGYAESRGESGCGGVADSRPREVDQRKNGEGCVFDGQNAFGREYPAPHELKGDQKEDYAEHTIDRRERRRGRKERTPGVRECYLLKRCELIGFIDEISQAARQ